MHRFHRRIIAIVLVLSLILCLNTTAFATCNVETNNQNSTKASDVNWWEVGWVLLTDLAEKLINLDGSSQYTSTWAYLVSPSIEYNTGNTHNEFYFRPQVNNSVGTIRMHGHRVIFVDIFADINLVLSDASGDTVSSTVAETNQYMFYTKANGDTSGRWKAQYISSQTYKWQLYYAHYYNANTRAELPNVEGNFYFGDNNRVYQFSTLNNVHKRSIAPAVVDITQLNNQFINPSDGKNVDYLKDFDAGDFVNFSDTIVDISYDSIENATTFYFTEDVHDENIGWKFRGDLTNEYSIGDTVNLEFEVMNIGTYEDITFESLDYFEEAFARDAGMPYPNIEDYL